MKWHFLSSLNGSQAKQIMERIEGEAANRFRKSSSYYN